MHPLNNSSQVTEAPATKPRIGTPGYFSESNDSGAPSYPGADFYNSQIKEFMNALSASGVEFDPDRFDHLALAIAAGGKAAMLDVLTGFRFHESIHGLDRTQIALKGDGTEVLRADFPKLWAIAELTAVDQALIDANPTQYAANYGTGDGATTFTLPNYGLMPWEAAAGMYGAAGTTVEDQIQNITGYASLSSDGGLIGFVNAFSTQGAFYAEENNSSNLKNVNANVDNTRSDNLRFDASRIVRAGTYTRPKTHFSEIWIIHGEQAA